LSFPESTLSSAITFIVMGAILLALVPKKQTVAKIEAVTA
jgi:hypothetical protein